MKDRYGIGAGSQSFNQTPIQLPIQPQAPLGFYTKDFMAKLNEFSKNNQNVNQPPLSLIPRGYNPDLFQNSQNNYNPKAPNQAPAQASAPNAAQRSSKAPVETPRTAQDVRAIQKTLIENGYKLPNSIKSDGSYDGIFGPETKKALEDFQNKRLVSAQKPGQSTALPAEFEYGGGIDNPGFRALPDYVQQDIINNMQILLNGNAYIDPKRGSYFSKNQPFLNHTNNRHPGVLAYSFALEPEKFQPSGVLNF
jgi:hypothetical protein